MRNCLILLTLIVFLFDSRSVACAQPSSMWLRRDPVLINSTADSKARRPGDLLIIRVNERSDVDNRDQRLMQKQSESDSDASVDAGVSGIVGDKAGGMDFNQASSGSRRFNGNSQFLSERQLLDQLTITVVDTTPNGNLLINGTRQVSLEGDQRTMIVTGVVRAIDIQPDNSISSTKIGALDIRYESTGNGGAEQKFINQGWLGKKLNRIWPH
ncbi:MAG: flagellar basal body L-ring protein FlgH [Pirellulaceae bacterium]